MKCTLSAAYNQMSSFTAIYFDGRSFDGCGGTGVVEYCQHIVDKSIVSCGGLVRETLSQTWVSP